jgi:hypothetical protein
VFEGSDLTEFFSITKFNIDHSSSSGDRVSSIDIEPLGDFSGNDDFVIDIHFIILSIESIVID